MSPHDPKLRDDDRLWNYAERFFQRAGKTQWPTVRQCAKSLRWPHARVIDAVESSEYLMLTYYNVAWRVADGARFVETLEPR